MTDINDIFSRFWEIYMVIPERILTQTINIINKISYWAFVYTEPYISKHNYKLHGYIIFRQPQNQNWLQIYLGSNGRYVDTDEHPNKYRKQKLQLINNFGDEIDAVVRINRGSYKGVALP
jgi:hypothetical protein